MLLQSDYFKLNNGYLTRSKIRDYTICPNYFKRKHIDGSIVEEKKPAFEIGTGVDNLLAQIEMSKDYVVFEGDRRTKDGKEQYQSILDFSKTPLSKSTYEEIMGLAIAVEETDAYKELKDHTKQMLLQCEWELDDVFHGLAAMPDFIKIEGKKAIITDLKTSQTIDPIKYYYHCLDYWYFTQFAVETIILLKNGIADEFEYRHLVVEKKKNVWRVKTFKFNIEDIEQEMGRVLTLINNIAKDTEFKKNNPSFKDAILIKDPKQTI